MAPLRVLLLADSHLGFDHPVRPRIRRRRRGEDFLTNYREALGVALTERVDLVAHGGDVFHVPGVPASLVHQAFEPLKAVADEGIPVAVVPGNHERSRIPFARLADHPGVHVFGTARTETIPTEAGTVAVTGIPCVRRRARSEFATELGRSEWRSVQPAVRLLLAHQAFAGAAVGPSDYTFRRGDDVVPHRDVPPGFAAVLAGHIHRHQVLETDLTGRPIPAPVFYPGSVERTAFAERREAKGFLLLTLEGSPDGGRVVDWCFRRLYARPMRIRDLAIRGRSPADVVAGLRRILAEEPRDAVLRIECDAAPGPNVAPLLRASRVRALAPVSMNLEIRIPGRRRPERASARPGQRAKRPTARHEQGNLFS